MCRQETRYSVTIDCCGMTSTYPGKMIVSGTPLNPISIDAICTRNGQLVSASCAPKAPPDPACLRLLRWPRPRTCSVQSRQSVERGAALSPRRASPRGIVGTAARVSHRPLARKVRHTSTKRRSSFCSVQFAAVGTVPFRTARCCSIISSAVPRIASVFTAVVAVRTCEVWRAGEWAAPVTGRVWPIRWTR
jgi:hypothetical protein